MIRSRAPVRLSFGGGGTDIEPYASKYGGLVLNTTIDRYAYCTVKKSERFSAESPLAQAVLNQFTGHAPVSVSHFTEAPAGSGLGGSSSLVVTVVKALGTFYGENRSPHEIAEIAYRIEREDLGIKGGWQDQFAATFGGWNLMEFSAKGAKVVRLAIDENTSRELLASMILVDLGQSRLSSKIIERQMASYEGSIDTLRGMKAITYQMVTRILTGDVEELGRLLSEEWALKKTLDSRISNKTIDRFHAEMLKHGAIGGKLLGAGEGGHMVFMSDLSRRKDLLAYIQSAGFRHVPFNFDSQGVVAWTI